MALEDSGLVDGLGEVVCSVDVYDLEQNLKIENGRQDVKGGGISCETARTAARSNLLTFGINRKVQGDDLGISLTGSPNADPAWTEFTHKEKTCILRLIETPDTGENPSGSPLVRWNIGLACDGEAEWMLLAEERTNISVKIERVRVIKDRIVVFTRVTYPDFEGPGSSLTFIAARFRSIPPKGIKYTMEVIGFSDDTKLFAYWLSGEYKQKGQTRIHAALMVHSTETGQPVMSETESGGAAALGQLKARMAGELASRKLGKDPGTELYKSGTATKTSFSLGVRGTYELLLKTEAGPGDDIVDVLLTGPDRKTTSLITHSEGYNRSLNTVRLSRDGSVLAVVTKYSRSTYAGENREYSVVFSRPGTR
jgi:hypothetical protein